MLFAFGDTTPSDATIFHWFREFKCGHTSLKDNEHTGRQPRLKKISLLWTDPLERVLGYLGVLKTSLLSILTILLSHLHLRNVSARWKSHNLAGDQILARIEWFQEKLHRF